MKTPQGSVKRRGSRYLARITWTDETGRRRERARFVYSKNEALDCINEWRREWFATGTVSPPRYHSQNAKTFGDLVTLYRERYAKEPVYRDERLVSGQRAWRTRRLHIDVLTEEFGEHRPLRQIAYGDLHELRDKLLGRKAKAGGELSLSYVNRVMSTLRRMLTIARQNGWMNRDHDPFSEGDPLIILSHERERQRILTKEEEAELLKHCTESKKRAHLRVAIIMALETGMRMGEMMKLERESVDIEEGIIRVKAFHTKTMEERLVPITSRLRLELKEWFAQLSPAQTTVIGVANVDTAFRGAKKDAKITGLRFHDLRHTAATRMIDAGIPAEKVGRILGHRIAQTTRRYINVDVAGAREAARKMDRNRRVRVRK